MRRARMRDAGCGTRGLLENDRVLREPSGAGPEEGNAQPVEDVLEGPPSARTSSHDRPSTSKSISFTAGVRRIGLWTRRSGTHLPVGKA